MAIQKKEQIIWEPFIVLSFKPVNEASSSSPSLQYTCAFSLVTTRNERTSAFSFSCPDFLDRSFWCTVSIKQICVERRIIWMTRGTKGKTKPVSSAKVGLCCSMHEACQMYLFSLHGMFGVGGSAGPFCKVQSKQEQGFYCPVLNKNSSPLLHSQNNTGEETVLLSRGGKLPLLHAPQNYLLS